MNTVRYLGIVLVKDGRLSYHISQVFAGQNTVLHIVVKHLNSPTEDCLENIGNGTYSLRVPVPTVPIFWVL